MAIQLEGLTRNAGKHAGGVVIAPSKLTDFSPLFCDEEGQGLVTQYDKMTLRMPVSSNSTSWAQNTDHHRLGSGDD